MTDVLTPEQRRLNMSRIRGRDTVPEMFVRRGLHTMGLRFRLHDRNLPGRPDLVFPRYRTVVFVHGCFWHAHGCRFTKLPQTRQGFWRKKIEGNAERDMRVVTELHAARWHILVIWECALRGRGPAPRSAVLEQAANYLAYGRRRVLEIRGSPPRHTRRPCAPQILDPAHPAHREYS